MTYTLDGQIKLDLLLPDWLIVPNIKIFYWYAKVQNIITI